MLTAAGHQAYFVGGCVRNALLGQPVDDIDISTDARPERVMDLAAQAGLKAVPTGIDHGTITVVSGHIPHEITTFRKDVETDGRRAVVAFSDDLHDDALRRDFTMNALYADALGEVTDPVAGLADLTRGHVRFIEDPDRRIREDYLRILRFFRFYAWYGAPSTGADPDALGAIAANLDGLAQLSRERVGKEMLKLLAAKDPGMALSSMQITGVLSRLLPGAEARMIPVLVHMEEATGTAPEPLRRLAVLGGDEVAERLRLSRKDAQRLEQTRDAVQEMTAVGEVGYRWGAEIARDVVLIQAVLSEHPLSAQDLAAGAQGAGAVFPLKAADLMPAYGGPALGRMLKQLEAAWIASGFTLDRAALLTRADEAGPEADPEG
ncbi:CCA tRNA nucleotidyltransferase [Pseudooceanicola nanhaiensis]|uniref:CCA tRNA nucleotidyltransferase n=1 Tax=Pseudooceanicola nanhaiensis TaxID=375761 RepID=UPI001CD1E683|nr:CCA tRNA nucleotidyltransferase [Pseudooceanicola nanhaiensis]MCA0920299.1 CCA tRNA nucleotidyltransferase [Pseudooceanicola nanhaiensis]